MSLICRQSAIIRGRTYTRFFSLLIEPRKEGGKRWQKQQHQQRSRPAARRRPRASPKFSTTSRRRRTCPARKSAAVLDALTADIGKSLGKKGNGVYQIPGLCKIVRKQNPAKPAREGINPATGEKIMIKAKPASTAVKVRALKNLKDMVK